MEELKFPKNFLWGAGTSAHQVEGDNSNNDWWEAESQGLVPHRSEKAIDHHNRFAQDFDLAQSLSLNAVRFSIEWSRIEPEPGKFDEAATNHYRRMILYLREKRIEPIVTLHHITNPKWFAKLGGWENKNSVKYFSRYTKYCHAHFGDYIKWWVTINEPTAAVAMGYFKGAWPPFKKNYFLGIRALLNLAAAHKKAYKILKGAGRIRSGLMVGLAHNVSAYVPARNFNILERILAKVFNFFGNHLFLKLIRRHYDYIGVNYYFLQRVYLNKLPTFIAPLGAPRSDMGWEIAPQGMLQALVEMSKYKKPILITENGLADAADDKRWSFILNHLIMVYTGISYGIDIKGYLHWSLLDNFEWADGFTPRFGLIGVNYGTQERNVRTSARYYANIAHKNAIAVEAIKNTIEPNLAEYPEILQRYLQKIIRIKPQE